MAGTQADMKVRITDELARADLAPEIALAIGDAISFFQNERFLFNESRDLTFSTTAGQDIYGAATLPAIPNLFAIDYVILYLGSIPWPLHRDQPIDVEIYNQNGLMRGQPIKYCYFNKAIRLGPVPDQVYSIRLAGQVTVAAPASDTEVANPWMIDAERLIRSRAKFEIFKHVTHDQQKAADMAQQSDEAFSQLKDLVNRLVATGTMAPDQF